MTNRTDNTNTPRTVLITTGLRPVSMAFADFPGTPTGIIVWDSVNAFPGKIGECIRRIRCQFSGKRYASLKHLCEQHDLKYAECNKRDPQGLQTILENWQAELVITSGCAIVPMQPLSELRYGGINLHPSRLPDWRGANPLFWQVVSDQDDMGVTVHVLSEKIDAGQLLAQTTIKQPDGASRQQLTELLEGEAGVRLLKECVEAIATGTQKPVVQISSNTPYAKRVSDKELAQVLPLTTLHAQTLWNLLRYYGYAPTDWVGITGWRRYIRWAPYERVSTEQLVSRGQDSTIEQHNLLAKTQASTAASTASSANSPAKQSENWLLSANGYKIELSHESGRITLVPKRMVRLIEFFRQLTAKPTSGGSTVAGS